VAEVRDEVLDLALGVMEREGEVFEALLPDEVGTDAVEHHGGTEALLGRLVRFSDPLEGSAENLADSLNAIVPILREGFDVFDRVLRVGVVDVVFGVYSSHAPGMKKRPSLLPTGSNFSGEVVPVRELFRLNGCLSELVFPIGKIAACSAT